MLTIPYSPLLLCIETSTLLINEALFGCRNPSELSCARTVASCSANVSRWRSTPSSMTAISTFRSSISLLFRAISRSIRATAFRASRSSFLNERRSAARLASWPMRVRFHSGESVLAFFERMQPLEPDAQGYAHVAPFHRQHLLRGPTVLL